MTDYQFDYEDEHNYYFSTGRIVGSWWKSKERIGLCKLCGQEYQLPQRHGPIDLTQSTGRGIGPDVCTECGRRHDMTFQFMTYGMEYTAVCPECLEAHHNIDPVKLLDRIYKKLWEESASPKPDLEKVC